ncbi:MAG: efflux RND transporter periplasmic adaptor subunit [Lentisphaerae bacterium]|nr:efflux RND transporter periplasmic adaptor subunit [Lentisphaerota bacterium]MCP4100006.1 efflux RND transporter periplasmic adaptor subunit [Lentisphaerota bacterium]
MKKILVLFAATIILISGLTTRASDYSTELPVKIVLFPIHESVLSGQVNSVLIKFLFKAGESFKKGDIIAKLDSSRYLQFKEQSESEYSESLKTLEYFNHVLKGNMELFKKGMQGEQEVAKNRLDVERAAAGVRKAKAKLKLSEIDFDACSIKAPYSGRFVQKLINEYEFVRTGQALCSIIEDEQLLAVMNLPEKMLNKVKIGQQLKVKLDQNGKTIVGKIFTIAADLDYSSHTFEVKAIVQNKAHSLKAGMTGILLK